MDKTITAFLAECDAVIRAEFPDLPDLPWTIQRKFASAHFDDLGGLYGIPTVVVMRDDAEVSISPAELLEGETIIRAGTTLVAVRPPEIVPIINRLKELGWKRSSTNHTAYGWNVYAYLKEDDLEVRIFGWVDKRPDGLDNRYPYFAPPAPDAKDSRKKGWVDEAKEWQRKCWDDEW